MSGSLVQDARITHWPDGNMYIYGAMASGLKMVENPSFLTGYTVSDVSFSAGNMEMAGPPTLNLNQIISTTKPTPIYTRSLGNKKYELTDHLGNVRAVISDLKTSTLTAAPNYDPTDFQPDMLAGYNYYPFGMLQPERTYNVGGYRYGFQGQEKDDEVKGPGNSVNYKYRMHDTRLGRFFGVDPKEYQYPFYSPYAFSGNRVVDAVELEGAQPGLLNSTHFDVAYYYVKYSLFNWRDEVIDGAQTYSSGREMMRDNPISHAGLNRSVAGATKVAYKSVEALEVGAQAIGMIPGVDIVTDPLLAAYFGVKGDYESASSYTLASTLPVISGPIWIGAGRTLRYALRETDIDLRNTGIAFRDALELAFEKTGVPKSEFRITKEAKTIDGKTIPVEFTSTGGAEVSIDFGHILNPKAPDLPHIGWKTETKKKAGGEKGHIFVDEVPAGRQQVPEADGSYKN